MPEETAQTPQGTSTFAGGNEGNSQQGAPGQGVPAPEPRPNPMLSDPNRSMPEQSGEGVPPTEHLQQTQEQSQQAQEPPKVPELDKPEESDYNFDGNYLGNLKEDPMLAPVVGWLETELSSGKVDMERAFGHAVSRNDPSLIDAAYLREKLGDKADQVLSTAKQTMEYVQGKAQQSLQEVYSKFGGEQAAKSAAAYFNANAEPAAKAAIKQLLDSGNKEAMEYAIGQITDYARNAGHAITHNSPTLGQPSAAKGLSKEEYVAALDKLPRGADDQSPEYRALVEQRKLGRAQGI